MDRSTFFRVTAFVSILLCHNIAEAQGGASKDLVDLVKQLSLEKSARFTNAYYVVAEHHWTIDSSNIDAVRRILEDNAFAVSDPVTTKEAVDINNQLIESISRVANQPHDFFLKWNISFYNGMIKFEEHYVGKLKMDQTEHVAKVVTDDGNQYLFTDTTVYRSRPSQQLLTVAPLNLFADTYPLRLDMFAFAFNIKSTDLQAWKAFDLSTSGDFVVLTNKMGKGAIACRKIGVDIYPSYFYVGGDNHNYMEKSFGNLAKDASAKAIIPTFCLAISQGPSTTANVYAFSVEDISFGKLDESNFAISLPKDTSIIDSGTSLPAINKVK